MVACFEKDQDFKSKMIDRDQKCGFTHLAIMKDAKELWHATGHAVLLDGTKVNGVHKLEGKDFEKFLELHGFHTRFKVPVKSDDFAEGFCVGNEGKDYSESNLVGMKIPWLRRACADGRKELFCGEFVLRFAMEPKICGLALEEDPDYTELQQALTILKVLEVVDAAAQPSPS